LSAIISVALALIFLGAEVIFFGLSEISAISLLILMLTISLLAGWIMALVAERNFGMVNGDVLGATNELSRPLLVLVTLAVMTWMFL
ncbi:MAG: Cobalamin synthase, partial [Thermoplasmatales archaeon 49_6]